MLSKSQNKYIRSLWQQKYRVEHGAYIVEGATLAGEWLRSAELVEMIVATGQWVSRSQNIIAHHKAALQIVTEAELESLSTQQAPDQVLLVVKTPAPAVPPAINEWCLALDNIRDPGNMGGIIRIADWFGIKYILCSDGCTELYNPKVVRAAMGGHLRVKVYEVDLGAFLKRPGLPVLAATLDGDNVFQTEAPGAGILLIGNESKGISGDLLDLATQKIMIPRRGGAESLNAAVATGILCALLTR